jgi:hypothetical protein
MAGAACIGGKGRVELKSTVALKGRNSFLSWSSSKPIW